MTNRDVSHTPARSHGFTLVELMVTVAVVAILLGVAAPQLSMFVRKQQVSADINTFMSSLELARSEALKRNGAVSMCALSSATFTNSKDAACAASNTTNWSQGWIVYIDNSGGGGYNAATDTVLKVERVIHSGAVTTTSPNSPGIISFLSNGLAVSATGSFTVTPSNTDDVLCKKLTITRQGRLSQSSPCSQSS
jgi:type IV fimbrial biogenesis protein FimT